VPDDSEQQQPLSEDKVLDQVRDVYRQATVRAREIEQEAGVRFAETDQIIAVLKL
jgi:hypothetical protein